MEDLQEYVEILKAELEASKKREKARKVSCYLEYSNKSESVKKGFCRYLC